VHVPWPATEEATIPREILAAAVDLPLWDVEGSDSRMMLAERDRVEGIPGYDKVRRARLEKALRVLLDDRTAKDGEVRDLDKILKDMAEMEDKEDSTRVLFWQKVNGL
jgi:hypothetical protein